MADGRWKGWGMRGKAEEHDERNHDWLGQPTLHHHSVGAATERRGYNDRAGMGARLYEGESAHKH